MGPSKKANRKAEDVSQINAEDGTALQTTENVTKNKKRSHGNREERRIDHGNVVLALAATSENGEVSSEMKKQKKIKSSNTLKNNNPDQKLVEESAQKYTGESYCSPLPNTEAMPEMTNKPNSEFEVDITSLLTANHTVDENDTGRKTKTRRKKKKLNESQNNVPAETPKVEVEKSLVDGVDTGADITEIISAMKNRPNSEVEVCGHHITSLVTANHIVDENDTGKKTKTRRKKKLNESHNNVPDETPPVEVEKSLVDGVDTGAGHTVDENDIARKTKTRRKKMKLNESQNNVPDETPQVDVEKSLVDGVDTGADLTETISEMKSRPNSEYEVSLQTADQTGVIEDDTCNAVKAKRKRKSKRLTESQNNDPDETPQVEVPLSDGNDIGKELKPSKKRKKRVEPKNDDSDVIPRVKKEKSVKEKSLSDVISSYEKKKNVLMCKDQEVDRPSTSVNIDTNSMTKSDLPPEKNLDSDEETIILLIHRSKKKNLADSCGKQLLQSKEQSPSLSLQVPEASSKKSKRRIKSEKSSAMDVSIGMPSADNCDPASKKRKKNKRKEIVSVEVSDSVTRTVDEPQLKQSEDTEVNCPLGGDNLKEIVSLGEHNKEDLIPLLGSKSGIKDGLVDTGNAPPGRSKKEKFISLLSAVADVSSSKNAVNDLEHAHSNRRKKRKNDIHTTNEDKPSESMLICDPPANQIERRDESCVIGDGNVTGDVSPLLDENNVDAKKIHVTGGENLDASSNAGQMEEGTEHAALIGKIPSSPVTTPLSCTRKKLLVLDLNGILVDIVSNVPDGFKADTFIARKALFKRPFCDDFLKFLFQNFNVGVWSSRTKRNVDSVVDFVLGDMKKNLLFCWDQYHCTDTGYSTLENRQKPLVLKELKKLWNKHDRNLPWEKGTYNESNTVLLDDSPYKALRNPPHTAIFPPPYSFEDAGDKSLGPGGDLRVYLEGLCKADDVQNYVEQHRFGQRAITDKNPSWGFYLRIIGRNVQTRTDICSSSNRLETSSTC